MGEDALQITTKRLENGIVSGFMHDKLKVGDLVQLAPPFGYFNVVEGDSPIVCLSAGIGMTPMKAFADAHGGRVHKIVHVDRSMEEVPFRAHFDQNYKDKTEYVISASEQSETIAKVTEAIKNAPADTKYYVCGPTGFMCAVAMSLRKSGVESGNIVWEAFSPTLSCPV